MSLGIKNKFFNKYKNKNKVLIHRENGTIVESNNFLGLTIKFKGQNNIIEIYEPIRFKRRLFCNRSKIRINGNNNHIVINASNKYIANLKIIEVGSDNKIFIGENFYQSGLCKIDFCNLDNLNFKIGDNCMFGQNVEFMLGDWHSIYDINTKKKINNSKFGISIGNNVWIARNTTILKDVRLGNNNIVGFGSVVTKSFETENCIIAGIPAKICKRDVCWSRENTK